MLDCEAGQRMREWAQCFCTLSVNKIYLVWVCERKNIGFSEKWVLESFSFLSENYFFCLRRAKIEKKTTKSDPETQLTKIEKKWTTNCTLAKKCLNHRMRLTRRVWRTRFALNAVYISNHCDGVLLEDFRFWDAFHSTFATNDKMEGMRAFGTKSPVPPAYLKDMWPMSTFFFAEMWKLIWGKCGF